MPAGIDPTSKPTSQSGDSKERNIICAIGAIARSFIIHAKSPANNQKKSTASAPDVYTSVPTDQVLLDLWDTSGESAVSLGLRAPWGDEGDGGIECQLVDRLNSPKP